MAKFRFRYVQYNDERYVKVDDVVKMLAYLTTLTTDPVMLERINGFSGLMVSPINWCEEDE